MKIDSSAKLSTDFLNENDAQQSPSYSIKRNEDYLHVDAILSLLYSLLNFLRNKFRSVTIYHQQKSRHYSTIGNKLDDSFPSAQFMLKNFGIPYRLYRSSNGGRLLLYVRDDIPSMFLKVKSDCNIESIYLEVNLRKRKWFINGSYNHNSFSSNHLECLNRIINEYSRHASILS